MLVAKAKKKGTTGWLKIVSDRSERNSLHIYPKAQTWLARTCWVQSNVGFRLYAKFAQIIVQSNSVPATPYSAFTYWPQLQFLWQVLRPENDSSQSQICVCHTLLSSWQPSKGSVPSSMRAAAPCMAPATGLLISASAFDFGFEVRVSGGHLNGTLPALKVTLKVVDCQHNCSTFFFLLRLLSLVLLEEELWAQKNKSDRI